MTTTGCCTCSSSSGKVIVLSAGSSNQVLDGLHSAACRAVSLSTWQPAGMILQLQAGNRVQAAVDPVRIPACHPQPTLVGQHNGLHAPTN